MQNQYTSIINNLFHKFHSDEGLIHWIIQRFTAISVLACLTILALSNNLLMFIVLICSVVFHAHAGIKTLIDDYIHDSVLYLVSLTFLRITTIYLFKVIFLLFIFI